MKCDELKARDAREIVINNHYKPNEESMRVYLKSEADKVIAELKAENERLVKYCKEYDSRQRIEERIRFNCTLQFLRLKHALWLSRARAAETGRRFWAKENIFALREGRKRDAEKSLKMEKRRERQVTLFTAKAEEYE